MYVCVWMFVCLRFCEGHTLWAILHLYKHSYLLALTSFLIDVSESIDRRAILLLFDLLLSGVEVGT